MELGFNLAEGRVLHGLIEDASGDIVIRLDANGFILHASENALDLGVELDAMLVKPHIADLAVPAHQAEVKLFAQSALAGEEAPGWIHFPIRNCSCEAEHPEHSEEASVCDRAQCLAWYALSLRRMEDAFQGEEVEEGGALGLLRSVQHLHVLEDEVRASTCLDPATGLANRQSFCAALSRHIGDKQAAAGGENCMAILAIDGLRAIFMQYGQRTADEVHWGFARYLEGMCAGDQELALLDEERFAILLPNMGVRSARQWVADVLRTFAELTAPAAKRAPKLTASAGLARVEMSQDWSLRQAELGLVMARAGGGGQVGMSGQRPPQLADGLAVEKAAIRAAEQALSELNQASVKQS